MKRIFCIAMLAALSLAACARHETIATNEATAVELARVSALSGGSATRYSATVEPDAQVGVAFRISGYVEEVAVEEGDRVAKGTLLARIRRADYSEKLGQAAASQTEAQAALTQARSDLDRARVLHAANALTKAELDAAVANVEVLQARLSRGRAAAGEAGLALRDTALVAPIDGVILRRNIERGDLGQPGAVAFTLADTRAVKVTFGAPDTMIGALEQGRAIDVTTESMPERTFRGRIARVAPAADPKTRSFDVEVRIDNESGVLKPGMVAAIEVTGAPAPQLTIPLDAVVRDPQSREGYAVYVVDNGKARARRVELGEPMGNRVALRAGLRDGEHVIVSGSALLVDGQDVRPVHGGRDAR